MNRNELRYFTEKELSFFDASSLPLAYLLKAVFVKVRRNLWGKARDKDARIAWTVNEVSDATGPEATVRDYRERQTMRGIIGPVARQYPVRAACEVGCGYGRLTMVLKEYAGKVIGFEREAHLVEIARRLQPEIEYRRVESLDRLAMPGQEAFDLVMTCTVLQHLTDEHCRAVLEEIKHICPAGHVLLIEKTDDFATTKNAEDGDVFLSRGRSSAQYADWMKPFALLSVTQRVVEPGYYNPHPGSCMLFRSPLCSRRSA